MCRWGVTWPFACSVRAQTQSLSEAVVAARRSADRSERNDLAGLAAMVEGEVVHGAVEPASRLAHFGKLGMQFHERFLDQVLGHLARSRQSQGIMEERRFQSREELLNRFRADHRRPRRRGRARSGEHT